MWYKTYEITYKVIPGSRGFQVVDSLGRIWRTLSTKAEAQAWLDAAVLPSS